MTYEDYKAYADSLLEERDQYSGEFEERARMVLPTSWAALKAARGSSLPDHIWYCEEANEACQTLASGHMQMLTPFDSRWFNVALASLSKDQLKEEAETYQNATSTAMWLALGKSNFTAAINKLYLDRCAIGHAAMHFRINAYGKLIFTTIPAGTFALAYNEEGLCNTIVREFQLTAAQAVERYGEQVGGKILQAYNNPKKRYRDKFDFLHMVMPNPKGQRGLSNRKLTERLYNEVIIACRDRRIVEENGLYEFPFLVTRFSEWGDSPYGTAPASLCRDSIIRLEKNERVLDLLGEKAVEPPIVVDEKTTGRINMFAGGVTPIPRGAMPPQELAPLGKYDVGMERIARAEKKIKAAFYHNIIKPLAGLEGDMTATEIRARQQEDIVSFVHSFSMMIAEMQPFIRALFAALYRWASTNGALGDGGLMPSIPPSLKDRVLLHAGDGEDVYLDDLEVTFTSRLAIALKELAMDSDMQAIQMLAQISQALGLPDLIDNLDADEAFRTYAANLNVSTNLLRSVEDRDALRTQRAQAQAEQAQAEQDNMMAKTAKDAASAYNTLQPQPA